MIRLVIADDQSLVRGALAALLGLEGDIEVVAEVGRGDEVSAAVVLHQADVALLDVEMPGLDGIAAAALLRTEAPGCRVLMVTTFGRPGYLRRAMQAGATGFVVKDTPARQLADAVRKVAAGLRVVDPALAVESMTAGESPLTDRETDVVSAARPRGHRGGHCRRHVPLRRHGAQLPLQRHRQDRRQDQGRGRPHCRGKRLAALSRDGRAQRLQAGHEVTLTRYI